MIAFCALGFASSVSQPQSPDDQQDFRISANVENVVLPVTVVDHKGEFIQNLSERDFKVYEDGRPQRISYFSHRDIPVTVGIVVDSSGSMRSKRSDTVLAALHFVRLSNPDDQVFVVNFNEHVSFGLPENEPFTDNTNQLRDALLSRPCTGETALYDAVAAALQRLLQGSRDKKALILVSDGGDNASERSFQDVLQMAQQSNAIVYTIGLFDEGDPDRNPGMLKKLARATGGEAYLPNETKELRPIAEHIARDLRNQYTLVYVPSSHEHDGVYHRIQVTAAAPGHSGKLFVRTRTGYYAVDQKRPQARSAER